MTRISNHTLFIQMALLLSKRSTCSRRAVGCVILDESNLVLATGYNGTPVGEAHCIDHPCNGSTAPSGTALDMCEAIHAEQNALMQVSDIQRVHTIYSTTEPCTHCSKMIANTPCKHVFYLEGYPNTHHCGTVEYKQILDCGSDAPDENAKGEAGEGDTCLDCDNYCLSTCPTLGITKAKDKPCNKFSNDLPF